MRKRFGLDGSATSVSTAASSTSRTRGPYSVAACTTPSAAAAASRHDAARVKSPSTGVAPRPWTRAAASLLRTSASTWWPPRTSASSTADPTYPVPPVRNTRMLDHTSEARVFHHNSGHMTRRTLLDFFADVTADDTAKKAQFLVYDDGYRTWTWTYAELADASRAFARRLRDAGIGAGGAIAIWSENRPEWIAAMWGALLEGVVLVPIDYRASPDFLRAVAAIVDAKAVLVGDVVDTDALGSEREVWRLREIFRVNAEATRLRPVGATARQADHGSRPDLGARTSGLGPDTTAEIIFTSGATAEPKGVVLTHRNILANI